MSSMRLLYSSSLRSDFFFFSYSHCGSVLPDETLYTFTPRDSVTCSGAIPAAAHWWGTCALCGRRGIPEWNPALRHFYNTF